MSELDFKKEDSGQDEILRWIDRNAPSEVWERIQGSVSNAVTLSYSCSGRSMLRFAGRCS